MQQTKKVYSYALTKLILRVKKLEKKVKTNKARRRAMIVISEDEDAKEDYSKQGRKISEINKDPTISLVQPEQDMEYDFDDVTWMTFGVNTRDLGSFGEETDKITDLHHIHEEVLFIEHGDGVTSIKRHRRDLSSDGVKDLAMTSGHGRLKEDLESST
ncbi:hypothetical protein Tco_0724255 [Tanacetum coccineum]